MADEKPEGIALRIPRRRGNELDYKDITFSQLADYTARIGGGLRHHGVQPGTRVLLMVRPGLEFIGLSFALMRIGAVPILIDPGMGRKNFLTCVARSRPEVLAAIPLAHGLSLAFPSAFSSLKLRLTVGRRWFWGGLSLRKLIAQGQNASWYQPQPDELAAILFTSGSTGPPKGVCYHHRQLSAQLKALKASLDIRPGEVDLTLLPIFALFNPALGMTSVIAEIDPSRPATVDPAKICQAIRLSGVTNSFGSPVLWRKILDDPRTRPGDLTSLRRVLMAGAPVPVNLVERCRGNLNGGEVYTPFGATECLPLTLPAGSLIVAQKARSENGAGTCVGTSLPGTQIRIVEIVDGPIAKLGDVQTLNPGCIGEIIASGEVVTTSYDALPEATQRAKIRDGERLWHRLGDAGYFDDIGLLWFCGRLEHRVHLGETTLYPVCCEVFFNAHPAVRRSALIGLGTAPDQTPAIVVECEKHSTLSGITLGHELRDIAARHELTRTITRFFRHDAFPVDVRHNAKIDRRALAVWAKSARPLPSRNV